ncbi:MAG: ATP-binding cassette domain-containing protein [Negativicutes bacterium]|nr:ATP-binding cassette domain-containing protein [Negativicutes bacterium]
MSLIVSNLTKKYEDKTVLDHLSFQMIKPGVYALLGTNGAGKTTAIRMMLGMLSRDNGEVLWNNRPLDTATCNVGYLAEERGLYPKYALMDQLIYFARLRNVPTAEAKKRISDWAERLEVTEYLYPGYANGSLADTTGKRAGFGFGSKRRKAAPPKLADQLSKGNQQKIQFMTALISDPELIILDEPLSGLDPINTDLFRNIIRDEIDKGKYLIMSSHQMATVEEFCSDLTILDRGKVILQGHLNEIKKSYGRVNLKLKVEQDISQLLDAAAVQLIAEKEYEYQLKVSGQEQANLLLSMLIARQISIITFDLREPSLHEIFVKVVGESNETE